MSYVCRFDGTLVANSRSGKFVHTDELPKGTPDHEIEAVERGIYLAALDYAHELRSAAQDMLVHHASLHPHSGCSWAERLEAAARSR